VVFLNKSEAISACLFIERKIYIYLPLNTLMEFELRTFRFIMSFYGEIKALDVLNNLFPQICENII